jgi:ABC-type antimicrobial peptide transport system permease subunit
VWVLGCLVGLPLGTHVALGMLGTYTTDIMELAPVIYPRTIVLAAAVTLAAVLVSQWPAIRYIQRLNMAEVLRYRE